MATILFRRPGKRVTVTHVVFVLSDNPHRVLFSDDTAARAIIHPFVKPQLRRVLKTKA